MSGLLNAPYALTVVRDCGCLAGVSFESSPQGIAEFLGQYPDVGYRVVVSTESRFSARMCEVHAAAARRHPGGQLVVETSEARPSAYEERHRRAVRVREAMA